jgi:hypothetical protein
MCIQWLHGWETTAVIANYRGLLVEKQFTKYSHTHNKQYLDNSHLQKV